MNQLHFSANSISSTREITHAGRRYLVSPVVALREGVLNGVLVQATEFGKFAASWAGRPVPLGHPQTNGEYHSANTPDVWATEVPGHLWNVEVLGDKLKGEIWIDLEKAAAIGERAMQVVNRLRQGTPVEVSTGYFADTEMASGTWNGRSYLGIARNIRPDHLALLPDDVGACSWADGCGTPRVNVAGATATEKQSDGHSGRGSEGAKPMQEETSLFERFLSWLGQRKISDMIVNETAPLCAEESQQGDEMTKNELITGLVANAKCKFSKEKLQTWDIGDLQVLQESLAANEDEASPATEPAASSAPSAAVANLPVEITQFAEMIRGLGGMEKLASALGQLSFNADSERAQMVSTIVANSNGQWTEVDLRGFDAAQLRKLHSTYLPRDYSLAGGAFRRTEPEEEELLINWDKFFAPSDGPSGRGSKEH